jgi:hypothetical protein
LKLGTIGFGGPQMPDKPTLNELASFELLPAIGSIPFNMLNSFQDILQPFFGISHNEIASRKTLSGIRLLRARSVTTSTSLPRSSFNSIIFKPPEIQLQ